MNYQIEAWFSVSLHYADSLASPIEWYILQRCIKSRKKPVYG